MNLTIIRKEIVEHGWVLLVILPFVFIGFLLVLLVSHLNQGGSVFEAVRMYGLTLLLLIELVLCNRLVVQEYTKKTQLFLEGLPVSRLGMLVTKYMLGFVIVNVTTGICFLIAGLIATQQEPIDSRFVAILTLRLFAYVFATYSFFFMMGMLGRYRIGLYIALLLVATILSESTSLDLARQGPWGLLDDRFAYEREIFPAANLWITLGLGVACLFATILLGMVREGTVAGMLAEKMSYREKLFITATLLALVWTGTALDMKKTPDPYSIVDAVIVKNEHFDVQVEKIEDDAKSVRLAEQSFHDLAKIRDHLNVVNPPDVFLVNRSDLDPDQFEAAKLENASGLLMRVNYGSDNWNYDRFRSYLIDAYLSEATGYTAIYEPHCWVLEGFSEYWPRQESFDTAWNSDAKTDLRAAYAMELGIDKVDFHDWYRFRERLGQPIVRSVACSGLVLAERKYGREKVTAFLQVYLSGEIPPDFRADVLHVMRPIRVVWQQTLGSDYDAFKDEWIGELKDLSQRWAEQVETVPQLSAVSTINAKSELSFGIAITPTSNPAPPDTMIEVLYEAISPYDAWSEVQTAKSEVQRYQENEPILLAPVFARGDRIRWTTSVYSPLLECDVISGWMRQEVQ